MENESVKNGEKSEKPDRDENGRFIEGNQGGPGRPKGQSLKEFWKQRLGLMTEEEKEIFSKQIAKEVIWKMAEGQPRLPVTGEDKEGNPVPILGGLTQDDKKD